MHWRSLGIGVRGYVSTNSYSRVALAFNLAKKKKSSKTIDVI